MPPFYPSDISDKRAGFTKSAGQPVFAGEFESLFGGRCFENGPVSAPAWPGIAPPQRPGQSICQWRLPEPAERAGHPVQHEPPGQLRVQARLRWDNAPVESFFGTLKQELVHRSRFATRAAARREVFEYIEVWYNRQRRHSSLGYVSRS